jgi:hypothetical protein
VIGRFKRQAKLANEVILPDIFNLSVAPDPPKSAHRYAQRVRLALPYALDTIVQNNWYGTEGLTLNAYYLPPIGFNGPIVTPPFTSSLIPNPYTDATW